MDEQTSSALPRPLSVSTYRATAATDRRHTKPSDFHILNRIMSMNYICQMFDRTYYTCLKLSQQSHNTNTYCGTTVFSELRFVKNGRNYTQLSGTNQF